jgi:hypothetical protein
MIASPSNIVRVENFLSSEEINYVSSFCAESTYMNSVTERCILQADYNVEIEPWVKNYTERVRERVIYEFGIDIYDLCGTALRKWHTGERQEPHADCEAEFSFDGSSWDMSPVDNPSSIFIEYAALTYLNDEYEGGEIFFPEYDIEIKPKPGELIFFPGSHYYIHGVKPVTKGSRLVFMTFFTTGKLNYIWQNLVMSNDQIEYVDATQQIKGTKTKIARKNIPRTMPIIG